jgi:hypothetical protein
MAAGDETFVKYIQDHKDKWDDGTEDMTVDRLMQLALNKFTNLQRDGKWGALSADQERIVALSAQVKKINDSNLKLTKAIAKAGSSKSTTKSQQDKNSDKTRRTSKLSFKQRQKEKYAWKLVAPKDNAPKKTVNGHQYFFKKVNNKEYYWCTYHSPPCWVLHEPEGEGENGCRNRQQQQSRDAGTSEQGQEQPRHRVSFANSLATIMRELDEQQE